jgi:glycosyltransferase involved in cell wall biosynthesis
MSTGQRTLGVLARDGIRVHIHSDNAHFSGSEESWCALMASYRAAGGHVTATWRSSPDFDAIARERLGGLDGCFPLSLEPERRIARSGRQWTRVARPVTAVLDQVRPDVVHLNNGGWPGSTSCLATALAASERDCGTVMVVNNLAFPYTRLRRLAKRRERSVARRVDRFVTASPQAAARLQAVLGEAAATVTSIPNSITEPGSFVGQTVARQSLDVPQDATVVVCVARLERRKGHLVLLDGWAGMPADLPAVLLLAGDGPERTAIAERVSALRAAGHDVRILGQVGDPWLLYAAADCVVLPSTANEDMPLAILEAMCAARPVITTPVGGSADVVVDGETGLVIPPNDPSACLQAMIALRHGSDPAERFGAAGRHRYVTTYRRDLMVERYGQIWQALAAPRGQ